MTNFSSSWYEFNDCINYIENAFIIQQQNEEDNLN